MFNPHADLEQPLSITACALQIYCVHLGLGQHIDDISPKNTEQLLKVLWAAYFFSDAGIALPKASVLLFYQRVLTTQNQWFKCGLWLGHSLNFLWWLSGIARDLVFCDPVYKYWKPETPGSCRSAASLYLGSAIPSVVIDFYILILPLPVLARLSLKFIRKLLIWGYFLRDTCKLMTFQLQDLKVADRLAQG